MPQLQESSAASAAPGLLRHAMIVLEPNITAPAGSGADPECGVFVVLQAHHPARTDRAAILFVRFMGRFAVHIIQGGATLREAGTAPEGSHLTIYTAQGLFTGRTEVYLADSELFSLSGRFLVSSHHITPRAPGLEKAATQSCPRQSSKRWFCCGVPTVIRSLSRRRSWSK